jgi:hypothetical protein
MNTNRIAAGVCSLLLLCLLCGCDIGRLGMYKLSFQQPDSRDSTTLVKAEDEEKLRRLIRATLNPKGFEEQPGKPGRWYKKGAWVELLRDDQGELILKAHAFGGKSEVRLSERTEKELLAVLRQQLGLQITPTTPPKPPVN